MNRVIANVLTTLLISPLILPTVIEAQTTGATPANFHAQARVPSQAVTEQISPFDLTYLAYQGNLKDQGIPSYGALIDAIAFGKVTAQKVMQAAVRANRLPEQTLTDSNYRSALQTQLYNLIVTD
jgi:hypothetical protein